MARGICLLLPFPFMGRARGWGLFFQPLHDHQFVAASYGELSTELRWRERTTLAHRRQAGTPVPLFFPIFPILPILPIFPILAVFAGFERRARRAGEVIPDRLVEAARSQLRATLGRTLVAGPDPRIAVQGGPTLPRVAEDVIEFLLQLALIAHNSVEGLVLPYASGA